MKKLGIILAVVLFSLVAFAQEVDLEVLQNRVDLLEEYSNMIYDSLGTKLSVDDFDALEVTVTDLLDSIDGLSEIITGLGAQIGDTDYLLRKQIENLTKTVDANDVAMAGLDERLGALETNVLNLQGTINDGLPALRDMIYELSANLSSLEERLTSYVGVSSDEAKAAAIEEALAEVNPVLDDIKVTLDIHDGDILKIYETLGNLNDELSNLNDMVSELQPVSENLQALSLKVDMHDQDIVNLYDNLSTKADAEKVTAKIDELAKGTEENYSTLSDKVSLLEDYSNMIYDTASTKAAQEDVAQLQETVDNNTAKIDQLEKSLNEANAKVQQAQMIGIAGIVVGIIAGVVGAMLPQ